MSSLIQLRREELQKLASDLNIEGLDDKSTKPEIVTALEEEGVNYGYYKKRYIDNDPEDTPAEESVELFDAKPVLLKMDRKNGTFEALGHKFTREHPYALVSQQDAQDIIDMFDGFRLASPSEAKAYYS